MNNSAWEKDISASEGDDGRNGAVKYYKRDFWSQENLKFTRPHFRLQRSAAIVNKLGRGKERDLLDVGCGPGALAKLLDSNIHYYGIDIAIQEPAPNLIEADLLQGPIKFDDKGRRENVPMIFAQWQKGVPVTVFPEDLVLAKAVWPSV